MIYEFRYKGGKIQTIFIERTNDKTAERDARAFCAEHGTNFVYCKRWLTDLSGAEESAPSAGEPATPVEKPSLDEQRARMTQRSAPAAAAEEASGKRPSIAEQRERMRNQTTGADSST